MSTENFGNSESITKISNVKSIEAISKVEITDSREVSDISETSLTSLPRPKEPESKTSSIHSKDNASIGTWSITSGASNFGRIRKPKKDENDRIIKIMESGEGLIALRKAAQEVFMTHYVDFLSAVHLLYDISANPITPLLNDLLKTHSKNIRDTYLVDDSPEQLGIDAAIRNQTVKLIDGFLATDNEAIKAIGGSDLGWSNAVHELALQMLNTKVLPKFKQSAAKAVVKQEESNVKQVVAVLDSPSLSPRLISVIAKQHCLENYFYYERQKQIYEYAPSARSVIQQQTLKKMIRVVGKEFVASNSLYELNIPAKLRADFEESISQNQIHLSILDPITNEVLAMILRNSFPLYLRQ